MSFFCPGDMHVCVRPDSLSTHYSSAIVLDKPSPFVQNANVAQWIHEFAILPAMTVQEFARQTYWYPILWFVFATGVAFGAAILFWKRGPATASGQIPGVPVTWKFSGAAAIFTVFLLIFYLINPL